MRAERTVARHSGLLVPLAGVVCACLSGLVAVAGTAGLQYVVAALVGVLLLVGAVRRPERVALITLCLLPLIGGLRRAISPTTSGLDPIVALPLLTVAVLALALGRGQRADTRLSRGVAAYAAMVLLGAFNPLQGPALLGPVAAALALTAPLWFLVGRRVLGQARDLFVFARAFSLVAFLVALYGLKQQFFGFSANEQAYVLSRAASYTALNLNGFIRPFSTLSSGAEYGHVCALGAVAALYGLRRWYLRLPVVAVLVTATFLAGSRGALLLLLLGLALQLAWRRRLPLVLTCASVPVAALLIVVVAQALPQADSAQAVADSGAQAVVNRTVSGLAHPFEEQTSTVGVHQDNLTRAFHDAAGRPLGSGTGSVSPATARFHVPSQSGEADVADLFVAYGYPGLLLFAYLVLSLLRTPVRRLPAVYRWAALAPLLMFNGWFVTAEYASNAVLWALLGALDLAVCGAATAGTFSPSGADAAAGTAVGPGARGVASARAR